MKKIILVQLPIPQLSFGAKTGNIPLGAACIKMASADILADIEIIPESIVSYLSDSAIIDYLAEKKPDIAGFTVYAWNVDRSIHIAGELKKLVNDVRTVFGGPEITPDNQRIKSRISDHICDYFVYGEGELAMRRLLSGNSAWEEKIFREPCGSCFEKAASPYPENLLEPGIEQMMLLETQRGCPYSCGYCYYSKSRKKPAPADRAVLAEGFRWALEKGIPEIFLLDPSLDARHGLEDLLRDFAELNSNGKIRLYSEIRADRITPAMADLLEKSGFAGFEIGLQTINPEPLRIMNRKTDLDAFASGVTLVKERGIVPTVDLIIGLPGDTPEGFRKSVDFVERHGFDDDIQVFPLSILPGTDFRAESMNLGIRYENDPPYTVRETGSFTEEEIGECLEYAEDRFDISIYPLPHIDASWHCGDRAFNDLKVNIGGRKYLRKVMLGDSRSLDEIAAVSRRLVHPYQIILEPGMKNQEKALKAVNILGSENPYTPFEVIFFMPGFTPDITAFIDAAKIRRPHFLDNDLRFLYPEAGNRAVLFTLVTDRCGSGLSEDMARTVFLWEYPRLPLKEELLEFEDYDGILVNSEMSLPVMEKWQDSIVSICDDLPEITFSDARLQRRWNLVSRPSCYSALILESFF